MVVDPKVEAPTREMLGHAIRKGKHWFEYLDQIWNAAEVAGRVSADVLPALMLRVRKQGRLPGIPPTAAGRSGPATPP